MQTKPIIFSAEMMVQAAGGKISQQSSVGRPVVDSQGHLIGWVSEQGLHCRHVERPTTVNRWPRSGM